MSNGGSEGEEVDVDEGELPVTAGVVDIKVEGGRAKGRA